MKGPKIVSRRDSEHSKRDYQGVQSRLPSNVTSKIARLENKLKNTNASLSRKSR